MVYEWHKDEKFELAISLRAIRSSLAKNRNFILLICQLGKKDLTRVHSPDNIVQPGLTIYRTSALLVADPGDIHLAAKQVVRRPKN